MTQWLIQIGVSVAGGAILLALRILLTSRDKQGERLGRLEKWIDLEEGRRRGYQEAANERKRRG